MSIVCLIGWGRDEEQQVLVQAQAILLQDEEQDNDAEILCIRSIYGIIVDRLPLRLVYLAPSEVLYE